MACSGGTEAKRGAFAGPASAWGYDFNLHAVRVRKSQHLFVESFSSPLNQETLVRKPLMPVFERRGRNAKGGPGDFAGTGMSAGGARPREKGEDGSRRADVIAEVEVIGPRIVKIDRPLTERRPRTSV